MLLQTSDTVEYKNSKTVKIGIKRHVKERCHISKAGQLHKGP